ncbi:MAG: sulfatase [Luteolibacter sp.]
MFILADDFGFMDTGYNGNEFYETPNIDRMTQDGMIFDRAYSGGPNCAPTRACIISGMYAPRTHIWTPGGASKGSSKKMKLVVPNRNNKNGRFFESKEEMDPAVVSLAEMLKPAGYATARFGKWHLGADTQGFDVSSWSGSAEKDYGNEQGGYKDPKNSVSITDAGIDFIDANKDRPFFLYLAHFEVHIPLTADKKIVEKYQQKLESKKWEDKWNPTYAAMIEALDNSVGRIHEKLAELGLAENTLVIFSSDNGGVGSITPLKPLKGAKGSFYEGGVRVPTTMVWPNTIKAGSRSETPITSVDFMPTFAEVAGAKLPDSQPVDGSSFVALLKGQEMEDRAIFWHYPLYLEGNVPQDKVIPVFGTDRGHWRATPSSLMCRGDWKLVQYFEDGHVELYNVKEDISEKNDLSGQYPERAADMKRELEEWQKQTQAPIPTEMNPDFVSP